MKHRDIRQYLYDAAQACELIFQFTSGRTLDDYDRDAMFRSAVERQLTILGEALGRARTIDAGIGEKLPNLFQIIGLRKRLVHGYEAIDSEIVWAIIQTGLPEVRRSLGDA
jgi:uncharacterized protein with HEPN domain